jgi:exodeoxyribonuclease-3
VTPAPEDVWSETKAHGGTHVSEPEREALAALRAWGLVDAYRALRAEPGRFSWWDYRAGNFHRNEGMRIDLLYATAPVAGRAVWAEIDREARKGPPTPSDHAPVVVDLDTGGRPFDAGWEGALERIAARTKPRR